MALPNIRSHASLSVMGWSGSENCSFASTCVYTAGRRLFAGRHTSRYSGRLYGLT